MGNIATADPQTDFTWLDKIDDNSQGTGTGKIGTKIAGEYFVIGASVVSSTAGTGATITVQTAANCKTHSSGQEVHAAVSLNALQGNIAKYVSGTDYNEGTVYDAETLKVPTAATPGQKYYSCLAFNTATASYTTIEVEVARPAFWKNANTVTTSLVASQGTTTAGLPAASEWGFLSITATALAASPYIWDWDAGSLATDNTNQGTELVGAAASVWSTAGASGTAGTSANKRITITTKDCRNGDYLAYSFEASATSKKLYTQFWTGNSAMGRGLPAEAVDGTFKHLEVYSFAQPGLSYDESSKVALPAIVLRVPAAAVSGHKYYAGFGVTEDFETSDALFYTSVLEVTVMAARRYETAALWAASLLQPDFQTLKVLSSSDTPLTTIDTATTWITTANANWGTVTDAIPG